VAAPLGVMYATERDADAYAVEMAKKWIDERGPVASKSGSSIYMRARAIVPAAYQRGRRAARSRK